MSYTAWSVVFGEVPSAAKWNQLGENDAHLLSAAQTGWVPVVNSWSYASASTITVPSDATTVYSVGDKIQLTQSSTVKYFYIVGVTSTVLTVTGGTDYTVANSIITNVYFSKASTPLAFPRYFNISSGSQGWTGFSADPTANYIFTVLGHMAQAHITTSFPGGTSNATTASVQLPIKLVNNSNYTAQGHLKAIDNSTTQNTPGYYEATGGASVTTLNLYKDTQQNNWTNSGGKGVSGNIVWRIF